MLQLLPAHLFVDVSSLGNLDVTNTDVAGGAELDALLGAGDDERLAELGKVANDAHELGAGHLDDGRVVSLRDS